MGISVLRKRSTCRLQNYTHGIALLFCIGIIVLMCSCASNKPARVGKAAGSTAVENTPTIAEGAVSGATSTAITGGHVLTGTRKGAAQGAGNAAGNTAGTILRELLK